MTVEDRQRRPGMLSRRPRSAQMDFSLTELTRFAAALGRQRSKTWINARLRDNPGDRLRIHRGQIDPYPIYADIRSRGTFVPGRTGELLTVSHSACSTILKHRDFGVRPAGFPSPRELGEPMDLSFLERDPPDHARLRKLAAPAFGARKVMNYRDLVTVRASALLDEAHTRAEKSGMFDLVADFAAPLPLAVITDLLGIEGISYAELLRHGTAIIAALDGVRSLRHARQLLQAKARLDPIFDGIVARRRRTPGDDIVSMIVSAPAEQGSEPLDDYDVRAMCWLLLIAGYETTVNLIANGVLALSRNPTQWTALTRSPELGAAVVEEVLRFDPPVQQTVRVAHADVEIGGVLIRKETWIGLLIGGANRDPATFDRPDVFDMTRAPRPDHLAFSSGIHYCLGAPLARLEATIAFELLARRMPALHLAGAVRYRHSTTIRGPRTLPVRMSR